MLSEVEGGRHRYLDQALVMLVEPQALAEVVEPAIHGDCRRREDDAVFGLVDGFIEDRADVHRRGMDTP